MSELSQELVVPATIHNPVTGELVPTSDLEKVGQAIVSLRAHQREVSALIGLFGDAALIQARARGQRTFHFQGLDVEVGADNDLDWDVEKLLELRDLGLPEERYNELVTAKVDFKVNAAVARQIAGSNPAYAAVIQAAERRIAKRPSVSAKPRPA